MNKQIRLKVNGEPYELLVEPRKTLLDVIREDLCLTGTKRGCDTGDCGACTILINGMPVNSCLVLAVDAQDKDITTIEGLAQKELHPVQQAWIDEQVAQCGYCQPGQVMSAVALLKKIPHPTDAQIDQYMAGNLCRCGTYQRIRRAIHRAAKLLSNANTP